MSQGPRYLLDANAFIRSKHEHYAFDFCPAYWDAIPRGFKGNRLRSIEPIRKELLRGKDVLATWLRKELWTHILAYNLIRTVMAQAASRHHVEPRTISFKGVLQTLEAFHPMIAIPGDRDKTGEE